MQITGCDIILPFYGMNNWANDDYFLVFFRIIKEADEDIMKIQMIGIVRSKVPGAGELFALYSITFSVRVSIPP